MANSMTAFGRARVLSADGKKDITAEIKSVNSRFLDCSVRLPRFWSYLEEKVKAYLTESGITRGKVEIYIGADVLEQDGLEITLDKDAAAAYIGALRALKNEFPELKDDISVMTVAQNRDLFVTKKAEDDIEKDWQDLKAALDVAIATFLNNRAAEGERLIRDLTGKVEGIREITKKIKTISEGNIAGYSEKLTERIKKLLSDFDVEIAESRILTEAAIFADKAAIDEELVRLDSHFQSYYEIIESTQPAGRRLDFLVQEMNRETNTIGSKSQDAEIAHLVVDIKTELEKIREQVQNIE